MSKLIYKGKFVSGGSNRANDIAYDNTIINLLSSKNVQGAIDEISENLKFHFTDIGSIESPAVEDRSDAIAVGKVILDYIANMDLTNLARQDLWFRVYGASDNNASEWIVSISRHFNAIISGIMWPYALTDTPQMYRLRRNKEGADTVFPFKGNNRIEGTMYLGGGTEQKWESFVTENSIKLDRHTSINITFVISSYNSGDSGYILYGMPLFVFYHPCSCL